MRRRRERRVLRGVLLAVSVAAAPRGVAHAAEEAPQQDRYELWAHGETNAVLFRRALLPGPRGTIVSTDTVIPLRQDLRLRATDVDTGWARDAIDVEVSAWQVSILGEPGRQRPFQGDVQIANVGYRQGPVQLRLGRQRAAGGAARYVRFDGLDAGLTLGGGFDVGAYGGFVALPQWNMQPGYFALGTAAEALERDPNAVAAPSRGDNFTVGGHVGWRGHSTHVELSIHEQDQDGGMARRNVGAIARTTPSEQVSIGGNALVGLDSGALADGRVWVDTYPMRELTATAEYLHTVPSLLLSQQSVLSVFSTASYDEAGATVEARPFGQLFSLKGAGYFQIYDAGHPGARAQLGARLAADRSMKTTARLLYGRVLAPDNGYNSVRVSLARSLTEHVASTVEAYVYVYDAAIRSVRTSSVYVATVRWQAIRDLQLLVGGSIARSPYAALDAQTQVRIAYDFDAAARRGP